LAIGEMVASGLTVSKLAVAASMLDDLARGRGVELSPAWRGREL
jgi:hypothetical protein